jgi:hypothetical protein
MLTGLLSLKLGKIEPQNINLSIKQEAGREMKNERFINKGKHQQTLPRIMAGLL